MSSSLATALSVAAVCLVFEALFSGAEIAIVSFDRMQLRELLVKGHRGAKLLSKFLTTPQRLIATTLMGTQLAVVTSTVTITLALSDLPEIGPHAELYTLAFLTPVLVIFGEIVPKSLMQQHASRVAPVVIWPIWIASLMFWPAVAVMMRFTSWAAVRPGSRWGVIPRR